MPTLVLGTSPPELEALLARRRRTGADRFDEVWDGVYHMVPDPSHGHARLEAQLTRLLGPPADAAGLEITGQFNLGQTRDDFRVPDGGLHRPGAEGMWHPTAALVVEIVSPEDRSRQKLPFYATYHVDEVLVVDPRERTIDWLALVGSEYRGVPRSGLIDLGPSELAEKINWP
ncbi:MAG: Uma2 family endonuclease [Solirubrobacteraceae bacterium]